MRSSDEKYARKILEDTKNTQERKIKKSFTGPYESEGRGFESLPAHQGHLRLQVTFFVYITCVHRSFNDSLRKQAVVFKRGFPLCTAHGPRNKARLSPFAGDRRALLCRFTSQTPSPHPAAAV